MNRETLAKYLRCADIAEERDLRISMENGSNCYTLTKSCGEIIYQTDDLECLKAFLIGSEKQYKYIPDIQSVCPVDIKSDIFKAVSDKFNKVFG